MKNRHTSKRKIENLFLLHEEVHVRDLYETLLGRPMECSDREGSQLIGSYLTRYFRATGNNVEPTGEPYTYRLSHCS